MKSNDWMEGKGEVRNVEVIKWDDGPRNEREKMGKVRNVCVRKR